MIQDLATNLWRLDLESPRPENIATGVLRVVSSPQSGIALSASDYDDTGKSSLLQVRTSDMQQVRLPPDRSDMITPLLGIDPRGQWGTVFEELEVGTGVILQFDSTSEPTSRLVDTGIEPHCCTCMRVGANCFAIVGGRSPNHAGQLPEHASGLAIVRLQANEKSASVEFPPTAVHQSNRLVRSLATYVSPGASSGLLAVGQDVSIGTPDTELWKIQPNGSTSFQGIVGQETLASSISAVAFDAAGEWLVRGSAWGEVRLTKLSQPQLDWPLMYVDKDDSEIQEKVIQIQIVGDKLIATFADATILIWNFYECKMIYEAHVSRDLPLPKPNKLQPQSG